MRAGLKCRVHPLCPWKTMNEYAVAEIERITHEAEHEERPVPYGDPGPSAWWHYEEAHDPPDLIRRGRRY